MDFGIMASVFVHETVPSLRVGHVTLNVTQGVGRKALNLPSERDAVRPPVTASGKQSLFIVLGWSIR